MLKNASNRELNSIFHFAADKPDAKALTGKWSGTVLALKGSSVPRLVKPLFSKFWSGKVFSNDGKGHNLVGGRKAAPFTISDRADELALHYAGLPVIDRVREVAPGLLLGKIYIQTPLATIDAGYFALSQG